MPRSKSRTQEGGAGGGGETAKFSVMLWQLYKEVHFKWVESFNNVLIHLLAGPVSDSQCTSDDWTRIVGH